MEQVSEDAAATPEPPAESAANGVLADFQPSVETGPSAAGATAPEVRSSQAGVGPPPAGALLHWTAVVKWGAARVATIQTLLTASVIKTTTAAPRNGTKSAPPTP